MIVQAERITYEKVQRPKNGPSGEQPEVGCGWDMGLWSVLCLVESQNVSYMRKILKTCPTSHGIDGETEVQRGAGTGPKSHWGKPCPEPSFPDSYLGNSLFFLLH